MNELKKSKVERFLMDEMMVQAVYDILRDSFLKSKGQRSVEVMAAERMAIDLLSDAWKDLSKFRNEKDSEPPVLKQVGL